MLEASALDGASPSRQFWSITFPLLSPSTFLLAVTSLINSLQSLLVVERKVHYR